MSQSLARALKRLAGLALCLLGLVTVLLLWIWAIPPYNYVYLIALAVVGGALFTGRPRGLVWTSLLGLCLAGVVSATFLIILVREGGVDWAHPSSQLTLVEVAITFGTVWVTFALGLYLWNEPSQAKLRNPP